jgi:hypothetical protein
LAAVGIEVLKADPAIRDHDPGIGADQRLELLAVAVAGDLEECRARGAQRPQRPAVTRGPPAGLTDMHRALAKHPVVQLGVRAASASEARWQIASTVPVDRLTPNRSRASSIIPRRGTRLRAVNVTSAACKLGPNADPPIPGGSCAVVRVAQPGQCSLWVRCSTSSTLIGGSSAIWRRPNRPLGRRSSAGNPRPQPRHASGL